VSAAKGIVATPFHFNLHVFAAGRSFMNIFCIFDFDLKSNGTLPSAPSSESRCVVTYVSYTMHATQGQESPSCTERALQETSGLCHGISRMGPEDPY
jgi:hypothetical protein